MKVKLLDAFGKVPYKSTASAAGWDLYALEDVEVTENQVTKVKTGIALEIPEGYCGVVVGRSGLTSKTNLRIELGVIDSDYRGELMIMTTTVSGRYQIKSGDKVAQMLLLPVETFDVEISSDLEQSERGAGGFGSTGS